MCNKIQAATNEYLRKALAKRALEIVLTPSVFIQHNEIRQPINPPLDRTEQDKE